MRLLDSDNLKPRDSKMLGLLIENYEQLIDRRKELLCQIREAEKEGRDTTKLRDEFWLCPVQSVQQLLIQELEKLSVELKPYTWIRAGDILYGVDSSGLFIKVNLEKVSRLE
jgi:hypothetical protein